ncbi:MAG: hypothetical protein GX209_09470 [Epulopiscium sp.]|nr:hypothetical protein [Candidatus Epulonipiscium sp.]
MIFVSPNIYDSLKNIFRHIDEVIEIQPLDIVYESINHHPDIFLFCGDEKIYISKEQYECIKDQLHPSLPIEVLENQLGYKYPETVSFNGLLLGRHFIHNLNYTSSVILEDMKKMKKNLIHVKQGYTRCSALPINDSSIITSDAGIAKAVTSHGIDVCLIQPRFILLPGQLYGFIGGTGGRVNDTIYFAGDISKHPDCEKIKRFIYGKGLDIVYDSNYSLIDVGSILTFYGRKKIWTSN